MDSAATATRTDRLAAVVAYGPALVGILPILALFIGYSFLPSETYASKVKLVAWVCAILSGIAMFHLYYRSPWMEGRINATGKALPAGWIKVGVVGLVACFAQMAVTAGVPMLLAMVAGTEVNLRYTVESADRYSDRKCPNSVDLRSMPFLYDRICGFPEEVRSSLKPGMRIELIGRGTSAGLFYRQIKYADEDA